jgi:hypothetical protein
VDVLRGYLVVLALLVGMAVLLVASAALNASWLAGVGCVLLVLAFVLRERLVRGRRWWLMLAVIVAVVTIVYLARLILG